MSDEEIDKWLDEEYGCSYTRLEELHDFYFEKYTDLREENKQLKENYKSTDKGMAYLMEQNNLYKSVIDEVSQLLKEDFCEEYDYLTENGHKALEILDKIKELEEGVK